MTTLSSIRSRAATLSFASLQVLAVRVVGAGAALAVQVLVARLTSPEVFGVFVVATACLAVAVLPAKYGLEAVVVRFTSRYAHHDRDAAMLEAFWGWANRMLMRQGTVVAALALVALYLASGVVPRSYHAALMATVPLVLVMSALSATQAKCQGLGGVYAFYPEQIVRPLGLGLAVLAVSVFSRGSIDAADLVLMNLLAAGVALGLASVYLSGRRPPRAAAAAESPDASVWRRAQGPNFAVMAATTVIAQADILLVGLFTDAATAAFYGAASRLSTLAAFALAAVNAILSPRIAAAAAAGERRELQVLARHSVQFATLTTGAVSLLLFWHADWALAWFGTGYDEAATALRILLVGQIVNALSGSVGVLQTMTGHERTAAGQLKAAAAMSVVLGVVAIPMFGIVGAAVATTAATVMWNLLGIVSVRRNVQINPVLSFRRVT